MTAILNGAVVLTGDSFVSPSTVDVVLRTGANTLAFTVTNDGGPAGLSWILTRSNKAAQLTVPATANIFAAGLTSVPVLNGGGGTLPPEIDVRTAKSISFSAAGSTTCGAGGGSSPVDGGTCAGSLTDITSLGSIAGIRYAGATQFLVGVFTKDDAAGTPAPSRLDFSADALGSNFTSLSPSLNQTFFIGDGLTSSGTIQKFVPPAGATRLYIGIADANAFQGDPGFYDDNTGSFTALITRTT